MTTTMIILTLTCMILAITQIIQVHALKKLNRETAALRSDNEQIMRDNLFLMKEIEKQARAVVDYETRTGAELEHVQTRLDSCWKQTADICRRYVLYRSAENEIEHIERNL